MIRYRYRVDAARIHFTTDMVTMAPRIGAVLRLIVFACWGLLHLSAPACAAETVYRLALQSELDEDVGWMFEAIIDSALSRQYQVIAVPHGTPHNPDSLVVSGRLSAVGFDSLQLEVELFQRAAGAMTRVILVLSATDINPAAISAYIVQGLNLDNTPRIIQGKLRITGTPRARVFIDGAQYGTPPFEVGLAPGDYRLEITGRRFVRMKREVSLITGETVAIHADLQELIRKPRILLTLCGLLAAGGGVALHGYQRILYDEYVDPRKTRSDFNDHYDRYRRAVFGRNALTAVSAALLTSVLVLTIDIR